MFLTESIIPLEGTSIGFLPGLVFFIPNKFYNRQGSRAAPFFDSSTRDGELGHFRSGLDAASNQ